MSIKAPQGGSFTKEVMPAGNYVARCYSMIELGTFEEEYMGAPKTNKKLKIGWEFPTETRIFKPENGEQPWVLSREFNVSMYDTSNLRKAIVSWRGKDFKDDEEAMDFDFTKLLGQPCLIQVVHVEKNGNVYANVGTITTVPKGMIVPKAYNPQFVLSYDDFSIEKFNTLPDFIKNKMKESHEYKAMGAAPVDQFKPLHDLAKKNEQHTLATSTDDLPF